MTINHPFDDAAGRGQTSRTAGSNVDDTDGGTRSGWAQTALRPE